MTFSNSLSLSSMRYAVVAQVHRGRAWLQNKLRVWQRRSDTSTGVRADVCTSCYSRRIKLYPQRWLTLPYEVPDVAQDYADQMHWRDNGICLDCGLEQSFYKFSEKARNLFYELGLDVLSADNEFGQYPPSQDWLQTQFQNNYANRLNKWDEYFVKHNISHLNHVLHLRCQYGEALVHFAERYGAEGWGMEMVHSCERYVREHHPQINIPNGSLAGLIEISLAEEIKFDLIVCFHTVTHSLNLNQDLLSLRSLLAPGGRVIFCDEINKKFHNPFHMVHFDEGIFLQTLARHFNSVDRLDHAGPAASHVTAYTLKGDNPDIVAWNIG